MTVAPPSGARGVTEEGLGLYRPEVFERQKWRRLGRPVSRRVLPPFLTAVTIAAGAAILVAAARFLVGDGSVSARLAATGDTTVLSLAAADARGVDLRPGAMLELALADGGSCQWIVEDVRPQDRCGGGLPCVSMTGHCRPAPAAARDSMQVRVRRPEPSASRSD